MTDLSRRHAGHPPTRLLPLLVLVASLVCVAATACAGPGTAASGGPAAPSAREAGHAVELLTGDATALRRRWQLFGALQVLTQRCMRERGLRYLVTSAGPQPPATATTADSVGSRSAPGYGITTASARLNRGTAQDRYVRSLSAAEQGRYTAALDGPADQVAALTLPSGASGSYATGGCTARARAQLYGTVRAALEDTLVPQDVDQLLERHLAAAAGYQEALRRWQRCMTHAGLTAKTPAALIQSLQAEAVRGATASRLAREQRTAAVADQRCDAQSGLRHAGAAQREAFLREQPTRTLTRLEAVWQHRRQALARAAAVLGADTPHTPR